MAIAAHAARQPLVITYAPVPSPKGGGEESRVVLRTAPSLYLREREGEGKRFRWRGQLTPLGSTHGSEPLNHAEQLVHARFIGGRERVLVELGARHPAEGVDREGREIAMADAA